MNCNNCGAENDGTSKYCPKCGQRLVQELFCAKCGKSLKADSKFCVECGTQVSQGAVANFPRVHAEAKNQLGNRDNLTDKSFGNYLSDYTWWWVPFLLTGILAQSREGLIAVLVAWPTYKYFAWKSWAESGETIPVKSPQPLLWGRLLIAILLSAIAAFMVAATSDIATFLAIETPLEKGFSPTLFYTFTGWIWFLILSPLYSWRAYKLLVSFKKSK